MKFSIFGAGMALLAASAAGCVVSVDSHAQILREEKRFAVNGTPDVRLTTFDGSIEINSWDRREVLVEIEKRGATREAVEALDVAAHQKGDAIDVEVKRPRDDTFGGFGFTRSAQARLIVSVPRTANLNARTGDGSIQIDRVSGRIQLRTGDGRIRAADIAGVLSLSTGDGSISVDGAEGALDVDTGDGGMDVRGTLGAVKLHTGDGSIVFLAQPGTTMTDDWDISTGDGTVTLYLPPSFGAELDAHTGDGAIRNDLAVDVAPGGAIGRRTVRGRIGPGGRLLRVRTGDGSIRLRTH